MVSSSPPSNKIRFVTIILTIFVALAIAPSCAPTSSIKKKPYKQSAGSFSKSSRQGYHIVKNGETLYSIARKYRVSVSSLKRSNGISNERDIDVGTKLYIPRGSARKKPTKRKTRTSRTKRAPKISIKLSWPLKKIDISRGFGVSANQKHDGIDFRAPKGTPILASAGGKVIFSGSGPSGYGKMVIIKHNNRTISVYAHNNRNKARQGEHVKRGQTIAYVGNTGRSTGNHLHFELRIDRKPTNPKYYLPKRR